MNVTELSGFTDHYFSFLGAYIFSKNGYNFLLGKNGCAIIISDDLLHSLQEQRPSDALKLKLVQHGLAIVPGKQPVLRESCIDVRYFIIDLTKQCNFHCIYCFRDFKHFNQITYEVLQDIIDFIISYCKQKRIANIGLQMWGGEPLLALDKIEYVINAFADSDIKAHIDIETNASLVTEEIARKLKEWDVNVGVSLDGTPQLQNLQRPLATGLPSSALVEQGVRNLQKYYGNNIGGISVVTKYNFQKIKEILDYFIYDLRLSSMKFNLVRDNMNASEQTLSLTDEEIQFFVEDLTGYLEAYRIIGARFSEGNIEVRLRNLLQRNGNNCCVSCGCQGGRKMISFNYQGDIFPCEMIDFPDERIGSIYDNKDLDSQIKQALNKNSFFLPKNDERCTNCPWQYFCQGGCSSRNKYLEKEGQIDRVECYLNKTLYPKLVEWILDGKVS